jgi:hypothetical protein
MSLLTTDQILRYYYQGEIECSVEKPFLVDRIALNITANVKQYDLPDYVTSIRRITYKGSGLDPLPRRNQREVFQNSTQVGTPFWYVYNNIGLNSIILFPCPPSSVALPANGADLYSQAVISTSCIVEFTRVSDNVTHIIPPVFRRQLLKRYVAANALLVDNREVNLRASKYYKSRWEAQKQDFFATVDELYNQPRRLLVNDFNTFNYFPGRPVLPINQFGISVNEGE